MSKRYVGQIQTIEMNIDEWNDITFELHSFDKTVVIIQEFADDDQSGALFRIVERNLGVDSPIAIL